MTPSRIPMPRLEHAGAKLYYAALFLCPPAFRREFSAEMAQDVDEAIGDVEAEGGPHEMLAFWTEIAADFVKTAVRQWLRTGLPILIPCSLIAAVAAVSLASRALAPGRVAVPAPAADRDLLTMIVLTGVVLVVIAATIFFTFWFTRPLLQRHRR